MIVNSERGLAIGLVICQRKVMAIVRQERRQEPHPLLRRHQPVEQNVGEQGGLREHSRDVGIAQREFLGHDAAGERIGAGAAGFLGQRERSQPKLRGFVERVVEQGARARLKALGPDRERLDLAGDELAHRVADFQLLRAQLKIVH